MSDTLRGTRKAPGLRYERLSPPERARTSFRDRLVQENQIALKAIYAIREKILAEFVVGPAVPIEQVTRAWTNKDPTTYGWQVVYMFPPWGVGLSDGTIAWFNERGEFMYWGSVVDGRHL